jgi:hypothetical protein
MESVDIMGQRQCGFSPLFSWSKIDSRRDYREIASTWLSAAGATRPVDSIVWCITPETPALIEFRR